jgi:hypothetical protein
MSALSKESVDALESLCKTGIESTAGIEGLQKLNETYATALALAAFWREYQPDERLCVCGKPYSEHDIGRFQKGSMACPVKEMPGCFFAGSTFSPLP